MPKKLAANPDALHPFWYKQNVSPPKSIERWDDLIRHFAQHLVERYGIEEVAKWYFEVWNEPNIDFWGGVPRQQSYFELYEHTARDLKAINAQLRVGGPATAAAAWIPAFMQFVSANPALYLQGSYWRSLNGFATPVSMPYPPNPLFQTSLRSPSFVTSAGIRRVASALQDEP